MRPPAPILLVLSLAALASGADPSPDQRIADLERRLAALEQRPAAPAAGPGPGLRLVDLSVDLLAAGGGSTVRDDGLATLQYGGHDPKRRGFTFQGGELSIAGAVDPFFVAELHAVLVRDEPSGTTSMELEEAFVRSTDLPAGLELKAGQYLTEFGRFNPTHPHAWYFIDQPIIVGRVFGSDGQRAPGVRLAWSMPTPWLSDLIINVQNADGQTCSAFLGAPAGGGDPGTGVGGYTPVTRSNGPRLLYSVRWANGIDVGDTMVKAGTSAAAGPNAGGDGTTTAIYGADLAMKWKPAGGERGWPFVVGEFEFIQRDYGVDARDAVDDGPDGIAGTGDDRTTHAPGGTLRDRGFVAQVVWGFHPGWTAGLRFEHVTGSSECISIADGTHGRVITLAGGGVGRAADPLRDDRSRLTPLVGYAPSEFAHFKLQYDYDRADHLDRPAHSVWLGVEFLIGTHPAHVF